MADGLYKAYVQTVRADETTIVVSVSAVPEVVAADLTSPVNPAIVIDDPVQFAKDGAGYSAYLKASDDPGWLTDGPVPYIVTYRFSTDTTECGGCPKRSWAMTMRHILMLDSLAALPTDPVEPGWDLALQTDIPSTGVAPYPVPGPEGPDGPPGPVGPPGATGSVAYQWRISSLTDADVDPGSGNLTIESTGGQTRRLALSETDGLGNSRDLRVLQIGDVLTVVYDADAAPPATSVASYQIVQAPVDMGAWWKLETVRTLLAGSPAAPPAAAVVQIVATWGPGELYLPRDEAAVLYEPRSALLQEAVWHVDAGAIGTDGASLTDLTGNNRDAVFGAGAAAPVVLPWSGEDYLRIHADEYLFGSGGQFTIPATATIEWDALVSTGGSTWMLVGGGVGSVQVELSDVAVKATFLGGTPMVWPVTAGQRTSCSLALTATGATLTVNGVNLGAKTAGVTRTPVPQNGNPWQALVGYVHAYRLAIGTTHILDPRNVSADYSTIANTGSAGGDWTINRAATGYKTAVVDRPLLLFGGGQTAATSTFPDLSNLTVVAAARHFGTPTYNAMVQQMGAGYPSWTLYANPGMTTENVVLRSWDAAVQQRYAAYHAGAAAPMVGTFAGSKSASSDVAYLNGKGSDSPTNELQEQKWKGPLQIGVYKGGASFAGEFLAAAVFDRALTDAEVAQVSQELAGTPHTKQTDPHPQYVTAAELAATPIPAVTLWADLPAYTTVPLGTRYHVTSGLGVLYALRGPTGWVVSADSDTGMYTITSWTDAGVVTGRPFGSTWEPYPGVAGFITAQRTGNALRIYIQLGIIRPKQDTPSALFDGLPEGWRPIALPATALFATSGDPWAMVLTPAGSLARAGNSQILKDIINANESSATYPMVGSPWPTVAP